MSDTKTQKAFCPMCKKNNTHKRKRAPGSYCYICKAAFRIPLEVQQADSEEAVY